MEDDDPSLDGDANDDGPDAHDDDFDAEGQPKKGTAKWFRDRLSDPLFLGSTVTGLESAFFFLQFKSIHGVGHRAMDALLSFLSNALPSGNGLPRSLNQMHRTMAVESWHEYEHHFCNNPSCTGYSWPPLRKKDWVKHHTDCCPMCATPRFKPCTVKGVLQFSCIQRVGIT
jgi:hypothetical protein